MSSFTKPAILEMLGNFKWKVMEDFVFYTDKPDDEILVPKGYITDLTTVPRIFWVLFPPHGNYAKAAIIHDYLYSNALRTKKEADDIFLLGMEVLEVPYITRHILWWGAHIFGRGAYNVRNNR